MSNYCKILLFLLTFICFSCSNSNKKSATQELKIAPENSIIGTWVCNYKYNGKHTMILTFKNDSIVKIKHDSHIAKFKFTIRKNLIRIGDETSEIIFPTKNTLELRDTFSGLKEDVLVYNELTFIKAPDNASKR